VLSTVTDGGPGLPLAQTGMGAQGRGQPGKEPFGFLKDLRELLHSKKAPVGKVHIPEPANPFELDGAAGRPRPLRPWKSGPD